MTKSGNITLNDPRVKFIDMWMERLFMFDDNPRGLKELESYIKDHNIKIFFRRRLKSNKLRFRQNAEAIVGEGKENRPNGNRQAYDQDYYWIDLEYDDGLYSYVVPNHFVERCLILGYVP